jgi:hypothetical protein
MIEMAKLWNSERSYSKRLRIMEANL